LLALQERYKEERERMFQEIDEIYRGPFSRILPFYENVRKLRAELEGLPRLKLGKQSATNGYHSDIFSTPTTNCWVQVDLGAVVPIDELLLVPARPVDFPDSPGFGFPSRFRVEISDDAQFQKPVVVADHTQQNFPNPGDHPVVMSVGKTARYVRVTATHLWERT